MLDNQAKLVHGKYSVCMSVCVFVGGGGVLYEGSNDNSSFFLYKIITCDSMDDSFFYVIRIISLD